MEANVDIAVLNLTLSVLRSKRVHLVSHQLATSQMKVPVLHAQVIYSVESQFRTKGLARFNKASDYCIQSNQTHTTSFLKPCSGTFAEHAIRSL